MGIIDVKVKARFYTKEGPKGNIKYVGVNKLGKPMLMDKNQWYKARLKYKSELTRKRNTFRRNLQRQRAAERAGSSLGSYSKREGTAWQRNLQGFSRSVSDKIHKGLQLAQREIMEHADRYRGYDNLTGNLITSTMSALYHGARAPELMQLPSVEGKGTSRGKLSRTGYKGMYAVKQFGTGETRLFPAKYLIQTNRRHARAEAREKLLGYNSRGLGRNSRGDIVSAIILTTGTEYADYLEQKAGLNVLSRTRRVAGKIVRKHILHLLKSNKQSRR